MFCGVRFQNLFGKTMKDISKDAKTHQKLTWLKNAIPKMEYYKSVACNPNNSSSNADWCQRGS